MFDQRFIRCILTGALIFSILSACSAAGEGRPDTILIGIGAPGPAMEEALTEAETGAEQGGAAREMSEDEDWALLLVNRDHPIPEDYQVPELIELQNGSSIDSRVYPALQRMFDDARAQGIYPYVTSAFRTREKQQALLDDKIAEYEAAGYSAKDARALALEWVALPGTSEHELGLSADISADPASGQEPGTVWYWLQEHAWEYGFIRRYPEEKTEITGIINEPWHFRYVGKVAAAAMHESGQCLEEYIETSDLTEASLH